MEKEVSLSIPSEGEHLVIPVYPGEKINLDFDINSQSVSTIQDDLVIEFPNNSSITLEGFALYAAGKSAPWFAMEEGVLPAEDLLAPAAGPPPSSGGAGEYGDGFGDILTGVGSLGALAPTAALVPGAGEPPTEEDDFFEETPPLILEENLPPTAVDDTYTTQEDAVLTIPAPGVVSNDSDPDGDSLTTTIVAQPDGGTVVLNPDGSFSFTPDENFNGTTSFDYIVSDGQGGTDTATVTIIVEPVNDPPTAVDDTYTTQEDVVLTIPAPGVVSNDSDPDGDSLTTTIVAQPDGGTVALNPDGSFSFTPDKDFNGTTSFDYTVDDGNGGTDTATVTITVEPVNDPPTAVDDYASVAQGQIVATNSPGTNSSIFLIDPGGKNGTYYEPLMDVDFQIDDITFANDGTLWGIGSGASYNLALVEIDLAHKTLAAELEVVPDDDLTAKLNITGKVDGIAYVGDTLYGITDSVLFKIDTESGAATIAKKLPFSTDTDLVAIGDTLYSLSTSGELYALVDSNGDGDFADAEIVSLGTPVLNPGAYGIATGEGSLIYLVNKDQVLVLDPDTDAGTFTVRNDLSFDLPEDVQGSPIGLAGDFGSPVASGNILANDTDPDNALSDLVVTEIDGVALDTLPPNPDGSWDIAGDFGTLTIFSDGTYTYSLNAGVTGETGQDLFEYTVSDPDGATSSATLTIDVSEVVEGVKVVVGTEGNDTLSGTDNNDLILGRDGNDEISGNDGNDGLFGEGGDDLLFGGAGDDVLEGGEGGDVLVYNVNTDEGADIVRDFDLGNDILRLTDVVDIDDVRDSPVDASGSDVVLSLDGGTTVTFVGIGPLAGVTDLGGLESVMTVEYSEDAFS